MKLRIGGLLLFLAVVLLGTGLLFGKAIGQGVAAAVSLFYNGNYVSSTNPLPVSVNGGTSPAPLPTASGGAAPPSSAPAVADYPSCINSGGNAAVTVGNAINIQCDAQGKLYVSLTEPTMTLVKSGAVATATTTVLVVGTAGKSLYMYLMAWESSGTNATNTLNWEYSASATCASGNTTILPTAITAPTATSEWQVGWGEGYGNGSAAVTGAPGPTAIALVIPAGDTVCGVTAGTTTAGNFLTYYALH
jgi:hypothetical protein